MITILHGDNIVKSRQMLLSLREQYQKTAEVISLEGKQLDKRVLEEALGNQALFSSSKCVIIEKLFALPKSKKKDELIEMVAGSGAEIVLWEDKVLSVTQLKQFKNPKTLVCKTGAIVFQWLDSLAPKNVVLSSDLLERACQQEGAALCFAMLIRQVRLLLQTKLGIVVPGAPFIQAKLRKQAQLFSEEQLFALHERLLEIDEEEKTSSSLLDLEKKLDLVLFSI